LSNRMEEKDDGTKPTTLLVMGMAGSGKTTFVQRLTASLHMENQNRPPYVINLDPAVAELQFPTNIDIRDTVKYKEVMKQYGLGPNGAIITSLNLFATKFGDVLSLIDKRAEQVDHVIIDTPGQIEVFTWSASGTIITETLASTTPTVILYVMDVAKCTSPVTFMSNMMYACSILYKTELPFVIILNKNDIISHKFALEWMRDYDAFLDAVNAEDSYISNLSRSLSLVLDDFYEGLRAVGFSSVTGDGMDELMKEVSSARKEYYQDFLPELNRKKKVAEKRREKQAQKDMERLKDDLTPSSSRYSSRKSTRGNSPGRIGPSEIMDHQGRGVEQRDQHHSGSRTSAREQLEEESFQRFVDAQRAKNSN